MPMRRCGDCNRLFTIASDSGRRCPACQQTTDQTRERQRGTTAQRGYGAAHQAERQRRVAAFVPGQPCARCGRPIASADDADLGHTDDRSGYRGLEHRRCNRGAPHRTGHKPSRTWSQPSLSQAPADDEADSDDDWIGIA